MNNGDVLLTKEFKALCEEEGFEYQGAKKFHKFYNADKKLVLLIRQIENPDYISPIIEIRLYKNVKSASSVDALETLADKDFVSKGKKK